MGEESHLRNRVTQETELIVAVSSQGQFTRVGGQQHPNKTRAVQ